MSERRKSKPGQTPLPPPADAHADHAEKTKEIDQHLLEVLDRWYQSYIKVVTFCGSAAGIILLYLGFNLIQVINDVEKENVAATASSMLKQPSAAADTTLMPQPDSLVQTAPLQSSSLVSIIQQKRTHIRTGIIFLTLSLLCTIICVLTTYNWYISGVSNILKQSRSEEYLYKLIHDKLSYRDKKTVGSMWFWGQLSLYSGWMTGIFLGVGVVSYSLGIWEVLSSLLNI